MQTTPNLNLKKPDSGDPVKISDLNENMDKLDIAVTSKANDSAVVHKDGVEEIAGNKAFMGGLTTPDLLDDELMTNAVMPAHQVMEKIPDISGKADKSTVNAIGISLSVNNSTKTLTATVNGKSDSVTLPGGSDIKVVDRWQ